LATSTAASETATFLLGSELSGADI
jgi:hypothetical protein